MLRYIFLLYLFFSSVNANAKINLTTAVTQPIPISNLDHYESYPKVVKELITKAYYLTQLNLTYLYGSAEPNNGGMDCSGTIYYLLSTKISNVPRASDALFNWVEQKGKLYRVNQNNFNSKEFSNLKPGDLLFWSGTYAIHRQIPITHVMLYLGKNKENQPLMFGASDGRTYQHKKMWGVSVFDFKLPDNKGPQRFVGYSCIPNLTCDL